MPTRLVLLCHAPSPAMREAAFPADEPAEPLTALQSDALRRLVGGFRSALCGPALRARQTAAALALDVAVDPALRDCDLGAWVGRRLADVGASDPSGLAAWFHDASATPHGGESITELIERAGAWLGARAREGGSVLAVTHPLVVRATILRAIEAPASSFWHLDVGLLSLTRLTHDGRRWAWKAADLIALQGKSEPVPPAHYGTDPGAAGPRP